MIYGSAGNRELSEQRPWSLRVIRRLSATPVVWLIVTTAILSLWLRAAYSPVGLWGSHDDLLFVTIADRIADGKWLGAYDSLTLAKGAFFSIFLALNKASGFPLKLTEHAIYLTVALFASVVVSRVLKQRWLLLPAFLVLAFSPTPWMFEGGARVTREPLYQSMTVAIFALTVVCFMTDKPRKFGLGVALGLVGGCYWLTREEGVWLLPTVMLLSVPWLVGLVRNLRNGNGQPAKQAVNLAFPVLVSFVAVVCLANSVNLAVYGVFRNNDLRSGPFPEAYGALARIKHDQWNRYVVFPKDARQRAYAVSPAARELESYFEGEHGRQWAAASQTYPRPWGCVGAPQSCNTEILAGWFVWALRDAVAIAGHYRSAPDVDAYYTRLANEINTACDSKLIPCRDRRASLAPVWRGHYLRDTLQASGAVLRTLVAINQGATGVPPSPLTADQARFFEEATNSAVSGFDDARASRGDARRTLDQARIQVTQTIAVLYARASQPLAVLALVSYLFLLLAWGRVKSAAVSGNTILILTALLGAVVSRVGLLGFLEATSIPSNNMLYLLPVVPIYLLFVVMSIGGGAAAFRSILHSKRMFSI